MAAGMGMAIKLCHEAQLAAEEEAEDASGRMCMCEV